jgi:hypothetical protein
LGFPVEDDVDVVPEALAVAEAQPDQQLDEPFTVFKRELDRDPPVEKRDAVPVSPRVLDVEDVSGMGVSVDEGPLVWGEDDVEGQGVTEASGQPRPILRTAREGICDLPPVDQFHAGDVRRREGIDRRDDDRVVVPVVVVSPDEVLPLVFDLDLAGQGLADLHEHVDERRFADTIEPPVLLEVGEHLVYDLQVLLQSRSRAWLQDLAGRGFPRGPAGPDERGGHNGADARLGEKVVPEPEPVPSDRLLAELGLDQGQGLRLAHRGEAVLDRLEGVADVGSKRVVARDDLGQLLEAGGIGHERENAFPAIGVARQIELLHQTLDESLVAQAVQEQQQAVVDQRNPVLVRVRNGLENVRGVEEKLLDLGAPALPLGPLQDGGHLLGGVLPARRGPDHLKDSQERRTLLLGQVAHHLKREITSGAFGVVGLVVLERRGEVELSLNHPRTEGDAQPSQEAR